MLESVLQGIQRLGQFLLAVPLAGSRGFNGWAASGNVSSIGTVLRPQSTPCRQDLIIRAFYYHF